MKHTLFHVLGALGIAGSLSCSPIDGFDISLWGDHPAMDNGRRIELRNELKTAIDLDYCVGASEDQSCNSGISVYEDTLQPFLHGYKTFFFADQHAFEADEGRHQRTPDLDTYTVKITDSEGLKDECGEFAGACHKNYGDHDPGRLTWSHRSVCRTIGTLGHEIGHGLNFGDNEEFMSEGFQMYFPMKLYQFDRQIGSLCIGQILLDSDREPHEFSDAREVMYEFGSLWSVMALHKCGSDIECAVDLTRNAPEGAILSEMTAMKEQASDDLREEWGYDGNHFISPADQYYYWADKIFRGGNLITYLTGDRGHLSSTEAYQYRDFARIRLHAVNLNKVTNPEFIEEKLYDLLDTFLNNSDYNNKYFKGYSVWKLTPHLMDQMEELLDNDQLEAEETWNLATKIIDLNAPYPCDYSTPPLEDSEPVEPSARDPYNCPLLVRGVRNDHIRAFYTMVQHADATRHAPKLERVVTDSVDYVQKFYPGFVLERPQEGEEINEPDYTILDVKVRTNTIVPRLMYESAEQVVYNDESEEACQYARMMLETAVAVECVDDPMYNQVEFAECELVQYNAQQMLMEWPCEAPPPKGE